MPLSLEDKAAGLLVVRLGNNLPPAVTATEQEAEVAALLDRLPIGGLILFNGRWPDTRDTLARLQQKSERGLLVTTDMERGFGQQVVGGTVYPHAAAFGEAADAEAVRAFARQASREALACGVHVTYSPVADVDRNPDNPIIGARAFAADPGRAADLVAAFVEGVHDAGQLATAKHFPGHGGTSGDSHAEMPVLDDDRATLDATDLVPFRAAIDAGVDLVMTAHVVYPALDPDQPATRSRAILRGLLRDELGFQGVVVTDSLQMAGAKVEGRTEADLAADLLEAGVDLFVDAVDPEALVAGLAAAVRQGRLDEGLIDAALARVEALRQRLRDRFGADVFRAPPLPAETVAAAEHQALAERVARDAIEVARGPLPDLGDGTGTLVVLVKPAPRPNEPETMPMGEAVAQFLPGAVYRELEPTHEDQDEPFDEIRLLAKDAERVVIATIARPAAWSTFGLDARERRFAIRMMEAHPTTLVVLGDARGLRGYDACDSALVTYSDVAVSQVAAVERLARGGTGDAG
ncbi:glycoside hydrolase family 3 N-terminal domain-containing protein [Rubrivirga sp.]|uniref:glycoside hydrolase family 3 N-terminal domain-containing protein n=1 Tax=Rubrivirga sp. TaxID=1885344 RepID=UPI003B5224D5